MHTTTGVPHLYHQTLQAVEQGAAGSDMECSLGVPALLHYASPHTIMLTSQPIKEYML